MAWGIFKLPSTKHAFIVSDDETQRAMILGRYNAGDALFYEIEMELREKQQQQLDGKTAKQLPAKKK